MRRSVFVALPLMAVAALLFVTGSQAAPTRAAAGEPQNVSPPTISGSAVAGQTLSAAGGTWNSSTSITNSSFQWLRCLANGTGCGPRPGATASTYTIVSGDAGYTIRVAQTVTNSAGSTTAQSAPTAVVALSKPVNTSLPTISGSAKVGQTLTAAGGAWSSSTTITSATYQWLRCLANGTGCGPRSGATASTYTIVSGDAGYTIRVAQTVTNSAGSTTAQSNPTAVVALSGQPTTTHEPTISGTLEVGQTVSTSEVSWSSSTPITRVTYQWLRCDSVGNNCANINGATSSSYTITNNDLGHTLRVTQTATNSAGTASSTSNNTVAVAPAGGKARATAPPSISGNTVVGSTLSTNGGQWYSPITITSSRYQWLRCDTSGNGCQSIPGATGATYRLVYQDANHTIRVAQTVDNGKGPVSSTSGQTRVVTSPAGAGTIQAQAVTLPDRLVISGLSYSPNVIRNRSPFTARFRVTDTVSGRPVSGALVYALGLPYSWVRKGVEVATDSNGWATMTIVPSRRMPARGSHALVIFVRARVPGQPILKGSSVRRLVQIHIR